MINIQLTEKKENEKVCSVTINGVGHAGFNTGNDIVCSAVSTLFYTFGAFVSSKSNAECECRFDKGKARIKASGDIDDNYRMFKLGLKMIEEQYPENIKLSVGCDI